MSKQRESIAFLMVILLISPLTQAAAQVGSAPRPYTIDQHFTVTSVANFTPSGIVCDSQALLDIFEVHINSTGRRLAVIAENNGVNIVIRKTLGITDDSPSVGARLCQNLISTEYYFEDQNNDGVLQGSERVVSSRQLCAPGSIEPAAYFAVYGSTSTQYYCGF